MQNKVTDPFRKFDYICSCGDTLDKHAHIVMIRNGVYKFCSECDCLAYTPVKVDKGK